MREHPNDADDARVEAPGGLIHDLRALDGHRLFVFGEALGAQVSQAGGAVERFECGGAGTVRTRRVGGLVVNRMVVGHETLSTAIRTLVRPPRRGPERISTRPAGSLQDAWSGPPSADSGTRP